MIFEKNEFIEIIENRMNLKFEELELVGHHKNFGASFFDTMIMEYKKRIFLVEILNCKELTSITEIKNLKRVDYVTFVMMKINNEYFEYEELEKVKLISRKNYTYSFMNEIGAEDFEWRFDAKKPISINDETSVTLKLLDEFICDKIL